MMETCCSREKYWSELDDKGRLERLRQVIKTKTYAIDELMERMHEVEESLKRHEHSSSSGKPVVLLANEDRIFGRGNRKPKPDTSGDDCYI